MSIPDYLAIKYYENGKVHVLYERDLDTGNNHGIFVAWKQNGSITIEGVYNNGKLHGEYRTYVNGYDMPYEIINCQDGRRHGIATTFMYTLDGVETFYINYMYGDRHGLYTAIHPNGSIEYSYFHYDADITEELKKFIPDVSHITDQEKTLILLQTGLSL